MDEIFARRSVRKFQSKPVELDKLDTVLRAGMQAPSAFNYQPWEFIIVTDEAQKDKIAELNPYAKPAKDASVLIIVLANLDRCLKDKRYFPLDLSAVTENILLQLVSEGLGGVWLAIYPDEDKISGVRKLYNLPENIIPFSVIGAGYPAHESSFIDRYDPLRISVNGYKISSQQDNT